MGLLLGTSPRGARYYCVEALANQFPAANWQCVFNDKKQIIWWTKGADDWESFSVLHHPDGQGGFAMRNLASGQFVCAEPSSHSINLVANRDIAKTWERFTIRAYDR